MSQATITGIITYRHRLALPATAEIAVSLQDVSLQDKAAIVLSRSLFCSEGRQVPLPFVLSYDPSHIDPQHTYAVQVKVTVNEQICFLNTTAYPVITRGHPSTIEIVVDPVGYSDRRAIGGDRAKLPRFAG